MKKCTYCGQTSADDVTTCPGCGLNEFQSDAPAPAEKADGPDDPDELVTLTTCQKLTDADLIVSRLNSAGIETLIPDEQLMQVVGFNLNTYGYVRVQVRRQDFAAAKALLAPPSDPASTQPVVSLNGMKTIASLGVGQAGEMMNLLRQQAIPAVIHTVTQATGLEMSEIRVPDSYYDRGCDVVEAWDAEELAKRKRRSAVRCRKCGSQNYNQTWDEKIGNVYQCIDCGEVFVQ
jgi:predicted  nucleic acid-binding Zn-ribbon protein